MSNNCNIKTIKFIIDITVIAWPESTFAGRVPHFAASPALVIVIYSPYKERKELWYEADLGVRERKVDVTVSGNKMSLSYYTRQIQVWLVLTCACQTPINYTHILSENHNSISSDSRPLAGEAEIKKEIVITIGNSFDTINSTKLTQTPSPSPQ